MKPTLSHDPHGALQAEDDVNQYLAFMLAGEEYGVDIMRVQEIKGWSKVTPVPNMPSHILGVINLRGTIVPIIDLREKFRLGNIEFDDKTVVVVVRVDDGDGNLRTMGMVVDAVSDVYSVSDNDLNPAPDFGGAINTESITGLATLDEKMLVLINIDQLINNDVLQELETEQPCNLKTACADSALVKT